MATDIVFRTEYPEPPDDVWRALTTPEALGAWLMQTDFKEARVGHTFRFTDRPRPFWNGICDCEVVEATPLHRFELLWGTSMKGPPTRVSFTLEPTPAGGTRLELRHSNLTGVMGFLMKRGMTKGWGRMVERSIPFVMTEMAKGRVPARDEVKRRSLGE